MVSKKTSIAFASALLLFMACGPRPSVQIQPGHSPQDIWKTFASRYDSVKTLALSGSFVIYGEKTYECKLQMVYAVPDSFAFLAEGTLGIDAARGALIDGFGFFEIPREKYRQELTADDKIEFDGNLIDLDIFLQAVFYFRDLDKFDYLSHRSFKYQFATAGNLGKRLIELNAETATPIRQTISGLHSEGEAIYDIDYYAWRKLDDSLTIPGRIKLSSEGFNFQADYQIKKMKINPKIPPSFFIPKQ